MNIKKYIENDYQYVGWMISFIIFFALSIHYVYLAAPLVPYMDSIRYIDQVHDLLTGNISLFELWHKHVGIMYQLMTLFEWIFWGLDSSITVYFTIAIHAMLFGLYVKAWPNFYTECSSSKLNNQKILSIFAIQLFIGFYFFSPANWQMWLLDLGFAQTFKNLIIAVYLYFLSTIDYEIDLPKKLFLFGILGGMNILFFTYNWSYPFFVTVVFLVVLGKGMSLKNWNKGLHIILPILISQIIFIKSSAGVDNNLMGVSHDIWGAIDFIKGAMYGAASVFAGGETLIAIRFSPIIVMFIGALFLVALFIVFVLWLKSAQDDRNGYFFASLIVFGVSTLAVISIARGGQGYEFIAAPRYFIDYQFIFIGFLGLITILLLPQPQNVFKFNLVRIAINSKIISIYFALLFGSIAIIGHAITYYDEYKKAPYRAAVFKAQASVYLSAKVNEINAKLLQTPMTVLITVMPIIQQYKLGSLRNISSKCNLKDALTSGSVHAMESTGRWIGKNAELILGACPQVFSIKGFLPKTFSKRNLIITVNGEIFKEVIEPGKDFNIEVNQKKFNSIVRINFTIDYTPSSSELSSKDVRQLAVFITKAGI